MIKRISSFVLVVMLPCSFTICDVNTWTDDMIHWKGSWIVLFFKRVDPSEAFSVLTDEYRSSSDFVDHCRLKVSHYSIMMMMLSCIEFMMRHASWGISLASLHQYNKGRSNIETHHQLQLRWQNVFCYARWIILEDFHCVFNRPNPYLWREKMNEISIGNPLFKNL